MWSHSPTGNMYMDSHEASTVINIVIRFEMHLAYSTTCARQRPAYKLNLHHQKNETPLAPPPPPGWVYQIITRRVLFLFSYLVHYVMWEKESNDINKTVTMDPCHIAQFLHLVTPQGVRRRDVIDWISCSHLYYLDLQTHPSAWYYCNHSHRLYTYTYPSVSYEWIQIPWGSDARALQPVAPPVQLKVSRINSY